MPILFCWTPSFSLAVFALQPRLNADRPAPFQSGSHPVKLQMEGDAQVLPASKRPLLSGDLSVRAATTPCLRGVFKWWRPDWSQKARVVSVRTSRAAYWMIQQITRSSTKKRNALTVSQVMLVLFHCGFVKMEILWWLNRPPRVKLNTFNFQIDCRSGLQPHSLQSSRKCGKKFPFLVFSIVC